jgi:hypothetical protein
LKTLKADDIKLLSMESKPFETKDLTAMARERVQVGPPASWIDSCSYDPHFTPKLRGEVTYLLCETQIHAELGQTYEHAALRLESQRAVAANAQRQIYFEPQTQSVVLHSVKIHRGNSETEHLSLDRIQFLRREAELEGHVIRGYITLLLLLEDVRPGDILEYSYTITTRRRVMPENLIAFFSLTAGAEIGKYCFLIRYAETRAVKWKASSPNLTPKITTDNGLVTCYWTDANYVAPEAEGGAPAGHLMFPWIQVSDCPDWQTVSRAVLSAWEKEPQGEALDGMIEEIKKFSPDPLARITKAIETVQDDIRYLAVDIELGGQIPSAPDAVIRRRYGDCKDVAFLLVHVLRKLDIPARPVLVHGYWTKAVASMLPSPSVFNHAIVEYEIGNEKRWVDGTAKNQGGGALNRSIRDFGFGLPLDSETTALAPVPKASLPKGTCEITESIQLDTSGKQSYLAIVVTTTGFHADSLRNDYANSGIDVMAKDRAQACANRFTSVTRIKPLEIRDDRNANEFVLAEAFEIVTPILVDKFSKSCLFRIQSNPTAGHLIHPGLAVRRHPLGLPYPLNHTHTVELDMPGLSSVSLPIFQLGNKYFSFSRRSRSWPNRLKMVFSLETLADAIPPDKLSEHRKNVEAIHEAAVVHLQLPTGYSRSKPRWDFGALPPPKPSRAANSIVATQKPVAPVPGPVTTEEKEAVALQKTAELAGMPATAKEMPPAREPIPVQADSEEPRASQRRPRKLERRCALAFLFFLLSVVSWVAGFPLRIYGSRELAGLDLVFVMIPSWICSIILGIFGWKQLNRYPGRYTDTSKLFATLTFALGGFAGLFLVPAIIAGLCAGIDYARAQTRSRQNHREEMHAEENFREKNNRDETPHQETLHQETLHQETPRQETPRLEHQPLDEPLAFKDKSFVFHPPLRPWRQVDPGFYGNSTLLAYRYSDRLSFMISGIKIPPTADPRQHVVDLVKSSHRGTDSAYELVSEKEVSYHGLVGWQMESRVTLRGVDYYYVEWSFATNGCGYLLTTLGTPDAKLKTEVQASLMFENFEPTPPQQVSESSGSFK